MTILVAGGDSFTFGNELAGDNPGPSPKVWCNLIAEEKKWTCVNTALGGASNSSISRKIINQCSNYSNSDIFVAVMWTYAARYEFRFTYKTNNRESPWKSVSHWDLETMQSIKQKVTNQLKNINDFTNNSNFLSQSGMHKFLKEYYKHTGSDNTFQLYTSLKEILYLQSFLKSKNIKYLFTVCDNELFAKSTDKNIINLMSNIDFSNFYFFDNELGFNQWTYKYEYPRADFHPLEQSHIDASKLLGEKVNEILDKN